MNSLGTQAFHDLKGHFVDKYGHLLITASRKSRQLRVLGGLIQNHPILA